jgi:hypothetical protein
VENCCYDQTAYFDLFDFNAKQQIYIATTQKKLVAGRAEIFYYNLILNSPHKKEILFMCASMDLENPCIKEHR